MKKTLVAALLCGASVIGVSAGSAFAGEITGTGDKTPIEGGNPGNGSGPKNAYCAYSGLQDNPFAPGNTQTPKPTEKDPAGSAAICSILNNGRKP